MESFSAIEKLSMIIIFLDRKSSLHVVDKANRLSAGSNGSENIQSADVIRLYIVMTLFLVFTEYLNLSLKDLGSAFISGRRKKSADLISVQLRLSAV